MQKRRFWVINIIVAIVVVVVIAAVFLSRERTPGIDVPEDQLTAEGGAEPEKQATREEVENYNQARWRALDPETTGQITFDQYVSRGFNFKDGLPPEKRAEIEKYIRDAFDLYDADHNQIVTAAEFTTYHNARFMEIDSNGDGILTMTEIEADEARTRAKMDAGGMGQPSSEVTPPAPSESEEPVQ